ncbi:MAG: translation initiation factor 2 [bacterium]
MKGQHTLRVQSAHLRYDMTFTRNLTIIQGDSATGKTTLVDMIQEYLLNGSDTGISLVCDCPCRVVAGNTWKEQLSGIENSLVFIDEGNRFVASTEFAEMVRNSDNYYVIVTREALDNLPYSVTEIYGIKSSGKFGSLEPVYHEMYRIYGNQPLSDSELIITEDSNSGYDFFSDFHVDCRSAGGAGNVFSLLQELTGEITVIADGAAFGSQMGRVYKLMERKSGIHLYLPESFEWIILSAGILDDREIRDILDKPYAYIESREFFSWERFFTSLLVEKSRKTWCEYSKHKLNPVYLQGKCRNQIRSVLPDAIANMIKD